MGLNDGEKLTMLLNVAAHSMNIGYHCDGDMFATGAAVLANIVDGLKRR